MCSYKNLEIYKIAHKLAIEIHKMTLEKLPKFEMFEGGYEDLGKKIYRFRETIIDGLKS